MHESSLTDNILFLLIVIYLLVVQYISTRKLPGFKIIFPLTLLWLAATAVLAFSGFLENFKTIPPGFVAVLAPVIILLFYTAFSKRAGTFSGSFSLKLLMYIQTFRVLMEFVLWNLYRENVIPVQMTFEGRNIDILVGLTAPLAGFTAGRNYSWSRTFLIVWNVAGIIILTNIVITALLSAPTVLRVFMNEPANTVIARWPFVWLPAYVVTMAYICHILSLRQLFSSHTNRNLPVQ